MSERAHGTAVAQLNGPRGVRLAASFVAVAVAVALVWVVLTTAWMWRYQERVVFQPPSVYPDAPATALRVEFKASDGHQLFAYLVSVPGAPALADARAPGREPIAVVIAFHGNADLAAWQIPWAQELAARSGATVLVPEYRGYAGIPGAPTYLAAAADARGAYEFVRSQSPSADIILYGHSLGTAVATELAAHMRPRPPSALVLVSPFTSARAMAARMLVPPIPWIWQRISRVHYDTRKLVAELESPVFVAHGSRDLNIPVSMGRQVYGAARRRGELLIVEGAGHNDVADIAGEAYWRWLTSAVSAGAVMSK